MPDLTPDERPGGITDNVDMMPSALHVFDSGTGKWKPWAGSSGSGSIDTSSLAKDGTLASILAKIITNPATEVKQDSIIAVLSTLSLESRPRADGVNWLNNPSGAAIAVPAGAKTMVIRPIASNAYFRFGNNAVTAAAPSGAVSDGSGSRFLFEGEAIMVAVDTATHYAVLATGLVEVVWWLS